MGDPVFLLQVVDAETGDVAKFRAGGPLEAKLLTDCADAIVARGVGLFRTEAHVRQDILDGMRDVLSVLKKEARHLA